MRPIKFRAWDKNQKRWVYFELFPNASTTPPIYHGSDFSDWQQFTGMHDKNAKDCYEGDIVRREEFGDLCEIVYRENWAAFAFYRKSTQGQHWSHLHSGHNGGASWEIVGTVYENKDLLV